MKVSRAIMRPARPGILTKLLILELEEDRWRSALEKKLTTWRPGGLLLTERNLRTPGSTAELLAKITRVLDEVPLVLIEEAGGAAGSLGKFLPPLPAPRTVASRGAAAAGQMGDLVGAALSLLGINADLAPVLDLSTPLTDALLGEQTFGADPEAVSRCASAFVRGLSRHGILACARHFPGLTSAKIDPRSALPVVGKPMAQMWREDLLPYRRLHRRLPLVISSSFAYKAYDFDLAVPASLSSNVLQGLLRVKLGYRGIAVADLLNDMDLLSRVPSGFSRRNPGGSVSMKVNALSKSLIAGCDVLVLRFGDKMTGLAIRELERALDSGALASRRVEEALKRVRTVKKTLARPSGRIRAKDFDGLARAFEKFAESRVGEEH